MVLKHWLTMVTAYVLKIQRYRFNFRICNRRSICNYLFSYYYWWTAWPGVGIDSLTGQVAFEPPPISNAGWTTGCGCTSIGSIPVPS